MSTEQPSNQMTRRSVMRAAAGAGAAAVTLRTTDDTLLDPVDEADAIAPIVAAGLVATGAAATVVTDWALREAEIIGGSSPPDGLTASALEDEIYQTLKTRKSTLSSTYIDNKNILEGANNVAYAKGKLAAIEKINQQATESEVLSAAQSLNDKHYSTVKENYLKSWNEAASELGTAMQSLADHPDTSVGSMFDATRNKTGGTISHTLYDGTTIDVHVITGSQEGAQGKDGYQTSYSPVYGSSGYWISVSGSSSFDYLNGTKYQDLATKIDSEHSSVNDGLSLWVSEVYGKVQSGELNPDNLFSPSELATLAADSGVEKAIADLMALNVAVDLEREAEVHLPDQNATIYGQLGYTGSGTLSVGTIDPTADAESYFLTYDVSRGEGVWNDYNTAIDGGILTLTSKPYPASKFKVQTVAGETATVTTGDFSKNSNGNYETDLSSQLDDAITEVDKINYYSQTEQTRYETIELDSQFEIKSFTGPDGENYDNAKFTENKAQTDSNYITKEEWEQLKKKNEKLIEKYEQSQNSGGGGALFGGFGQQKIRKIALAGGATVLALLGINSATG